MTGAYTIPPTVRTARLFLRPIVIEDAPDVFAYCSDPALTRYVPWPTHRTIDDALDFVSRRVRPDRETPALDWGITEGECQPMIGWIGVDQISDRNFSGELGYVLARSAWKRGLMTEAVRAVIDTTFRHTPLNRVESRCIPANRASARVMEKSGMTFEGVLREVNYFKERFHDLQSWSILRSDWLGATGR